MEKIKEAGRSLGTIYITIKGEVNEYRIHKGRRSVAEIREVGKVPDRLELCQLVNGVFSGLDDNDHVVITGGEEFTAFPRGGKCS